MAQPADIVITGIGIACPIGIGRAEVRAALLSGASGVGPITLLDDRTLPVHVAAEVKNFDPMQFVKPRKSIKVMARDAQLAITAGGLARLDAGLEGAALDPDRAGVVLGADTMNPVLADIELAYRYATVDGEFQINRWGHGMFQNPPLGMLKLLPNMLASHISIAQDARGPNNTIYNSDLSGLQALAEAASVIDRGAADLMLAGGASSRMQPTDWLSGCTRAEVSPSAREPAQVSRPFDAQRDGQVRGEGGAVLVLERRRHATARGAQIIGTIRGWGSSCGPRGEPERGLARAIDIALGHAAVDPKQLDYVSAYAASTRAGDRLEAQVLQRRLPGVRVTALKSYFGNLFAAGGAAEAAACLIAAADGVVPPTLNYEHPDPECPVNVAHGEPARREKPYVLLLAFTSLGQAAALVLGPPE